MTVCPRCGQDVAVGQEYCLECGVRLPGPGPVGSVNDAGAGWVRRAVIGLAVALVGAAAAVATAGGGDGGGGVLTATGGFATVPTTSTLGSPPEAGMRDSGLPGPRANNIVPSGPHVPPRPLASASVCGDPPPMSIRFSLPPAKNPTERLSGDQNG